MPSLAHAPEHIDFSLGIESYLNGLEKAINYLDYEQINRVINRIVEAYQDEKFIYIFGNGGSAATASHFVTDCNKGVSENLKKKFKVICLNDNMPTILAISNDINYDQVFKLQLENFLTSDDLVIGISGSGDSKNVIEAVEYAKKRGADTIGLVGFGGGKLKKIADYCIHVPVHDMQHVEDLHLAINHLIVRVLMTHLDSNRSSELLKPGKKPTKASQLVH